MKNYLQCLKKNTVSWATKSRRLAFDAPVGGEQRDNREAPIGLTPPDGQNLDKPDGIKKLAALDRAYQDKLMEARRIVWTKIDLKTPDAIRTAATKATDALNQLEDKGQLTAEQRRDNLTKINAILDQFHDQFHRQEVFASNESILTDAQIDQKEIESKINQQINDTEVALQSKVGNDVYQSLYHNQLHDVGQNSLRMLRILDKSSDTTKKAVVLANWQAFLQQLNAAAAAGKSFEFQPKNAEISRRIMGNISKDKYAKGFEAAFKPTEGAFNLELQQKNGMVFSTKVRVNFRMEETGMALTTLPQGTKLKLVSSYPLMVTAEGEKEPLRYIKVAIQPRGAVGYVASKYVDLEHPVPQAVSAKKDEPNT